MLGPRPVTCTDEKRSLTVAGFPTRGLCAVWLAWGSMLDEAPVHAVSNARPILAGWRLTPTRPMRQKRMRRCNRGDGYLSKRVAPIIGRGGDRRTADSAKTCSPSVRISADWRKPLITYFAPWRRWIVLRGSPHFGFSLLAHQTPRPNDRAPSCHVACIVRAAFLHSTVRARCTFHCC